MRSSASIASLLTLLAFGAATGCGDGNTQTTSTGGGGTGGSTGGSTTTGGTGGSTTTTGGTGGTGATGGSTTTGGTGGSTTTTGGGGSGGGQMIDPVVDCNVPDFDPPADPTATCEITTPGTAGVIYRGTLLLPDQIMHKGEVFVAANGTIACTDCDCSGVTGADMATVVTCANGVISPGLINPHDHITFAQNAPKAHLRPDNKPSRYDHRHEWRQGAGANKPKITAPGGASDDQIRLAELRFLMSGATTAAAAGGKSGLLRNVDASGLGEGLTISVNSETFPLGDSNGTIDTDSSDGCTYPGIDPDSVVTKDDAYLPHISEGINDAAHTEFECLSTDPPPNSANDLIAPKTAFIHGIGLTAANIAGVRPDEAKLIWSPRSNVDLYGNTAAAPVYDTLGVPIALGTDWLPSGSMNMLRELKCADDLNALYFDGHFTDKQLWQMVTTNAAMAIGAESTLGLLKPGYLGDVAIFNGAMKKDHRAVIGADMSDVVLVVRGGKILYGDDAIVDDLRPNCETLDVCTSAKRACVAQDVGGGTTLQTLVTASAASYDLFFCKTAQNPDGTPDLEPSCTPYRPGEYEAGIVAGTDDDGDGVPNAMDNCPNAFNPARPMDHELNMPVPKSQADDDGDGKGDVCDPCPLDANDACPKLDANDVDGDGWFNGYDNCPYKANNSQADADKDGHGDACDPCDAAANPGLAKCPAGSVDPIAISAIRNPADPAHPAQGDTVSISNAYVTAIRPKTGNSQGFYVQDDSLMPFTGIFIFTGATSPTVQIGNRVSITAVYTEFFELSELGTPTVVIDDPGTTLPFGPIAVADPATIATGGAMAEGYESMLISVANVAITVQNSDAPSDFDEFTVTGGLRIDDQIFDNVKDMGLNNACAVGSTFTGITGIHAFSFANYKLQPRFAADITGASCDPAP